jgi:Ribonuclease J C-terminal domain
MWNIFGDTDDITFGGGSSSGTPEPKKFVPSPRQDRASSPTPPPFAQAKTPSPVTPKQRPKPVALPDPISLTENLKSLVASMKPTYFPPLSPEMIRMVALSGADTPDPLFLVRTSDSTILVGTGFSTLENVGKNYPTFPDMRLIESERDHLMGWILQDIWFDIESFKMILEFIHFPFVYASRDVIAYIRDSIKESEFLDKCRFFELFSPNVHERKIGDFTLKNTQSGLSISAYSSGFIDALRTIDTSASLSSSHSIISQSSGEYVVSGQNSTFLPGEILDIHGSKIVKNTLKFTFDTFYRDERSIGIVAGYALKDREELSVNGVLTFVLEEDARARAIVGHIFIDSRGFVHAYEMMSVHKQILKAIRHIYEDTIIANPRTERGQLVQILRRELTKYCYLITGRTPVVMPIIIEH